MAVIRNRFFACAKKGGIANLPFLLKMVDPISLINPSAACQWKETASTVIPRDNSPENLPKSSTFHSNSNSIDSQKIRIHNEGHEDNCR